MKVQVTAFRVRDGEGDLLHIPAFFGRIPDISCWGAANTSYTPLLWHVLAPSLRITAFRGALFRVEA